ncbi:hypothetical protein [Paraburkholderia acidiphila]|uniref:Uncharacterized protein n=1 Tax=Paraburkholderia acidiphila TaxID=2571747 RepID=A0A7Z2JA89_9BURK|nr:hypothetical protein [Paraburkholderia acidiphila]QGZ57186.1 hypothetical protein FAZ97_19865 [Paraburkholderia acidiphila]
MDYAERARIDAEDTEEEAVLFDVETALCRFLRGKDGAAMVLRDIRRIVESRPARARTIP